MFQPSARVCHVIAKIQFFSFYFFHHLTDDYQRDISYNAFYGPFPPNISSTPAFYSIVTNLLIGHNNFTTGFAQQFPQLEQLSLPSNQFDGELIGPLRSRAVIPLPSAGFTSLDEIDISDNFFNFSSSVLGPVGFAQNIFTIIANNNRLTGHIPAFPITFALSTDPGSLRKVSISGNMLNISNLDEVKLTFQLGLQILDVRNNSDLPTFSMSDPSAPSMLDYLVLHDRYFCHMLSYNSVPDSFSYDDELFRFEHCRCSSGYFGTPPHNCVKCPVSGDSVTALSGLCGGGPTLDIDTNQFVYSSNSNLYFEPCLPTSELFDESDNPCPAVKLSVNSGPLDVSYHNSITQHQCRTGTSGRQCASCLCEDGENCYFKSGFLCLACPSHEKTVIFGIIGAVVIGIIFICHVILFSCFHTAKGWIFPIPKIRFNVGVWKVFIPFIQTATSLLRLRNIVVQSWLKAVAIGQLSNLGFSCLLPSLQSPLAGFLLDISLPFSVSIFGITIILISFIITKIGSYFSDHSIPKSIQNDDINEFLLEIEYPRDLKAISSPWRMIISWILSTFSFFQFGICLAVFGTMFFSRQRVSDVPYLISTPWLQWSTDQAEEVRLASIPFVLLLFLFPVLVIFLSWKLGSKHTLLTNIGFCKRMIDAFKPNLVWWDAVILARSLALALVLQCLPSVSEFSDYFISVILAVSVILQVSLRPYKTILENRLEEFSLSFLLVLVSCRLASSPTSYMSQSLSIVSVATVSIWACVLFVLTFIYALPPSKSSLN